jgi:putative ABC transport system permease protein
MAGRAALGRSSRTYDGAYGRAFLTLILTGTITTFAVTELVVGIEPWYRPQYVIPLLGMVLGNGLTGISLCLDRMLDTLDQHRSRVEMELALGATRWEAARDPLSKSVKHGMIPILNSMAVVGIVSIPGMMTGQILQGADPMEAVKYQIVVMFMIAAATSIGCVAIAWLTYRSLFNRRHQLRSEQIRKR